MAGVDVRVTRLINLNMFKTEIKPALFSRYFDNYHDIVIYGL